MKPIYETPTLVVSGDVSNETRGTILSGDVGPGRATAVGSVGFLL
jgi:hypothetical protein